MSVKVLTITPSPAIDLTYKLKHLNLDEVNRSEKTFKEISGKGINVALSLSYAKIYTEILVPVNENEKSYFDFLVDSGIGVNCVSVNKNLRSNITLLHGENMALTTKINQETPIYSYDEWQQFSKSVLQIMAQKHFDYLVIGGSLPRLEGERVFSLREIINYACERNIKVALDIDPVSLRQEIESLINNDAIEIIKPNLPELGMLSDSKLENIEQVVSIAKKLCNSSINKVLVSLGSDGAVLVTKTSVIWAKSVSSNVKNTVGSGDALLAGFIYGLNSQDSLSLNDDYLLQHAMRHALSWGSLSVQNESTVLRPDVKSDEYSKKVEQVVFLQDFSTQYKLNK